jgi:hypothetical protein
VMMVRSPVVGPTAIGRDRRGIVLIHYPREQPLRTALHGGRGHGDDIAARDSIRRARSLFRAVCSLDRIHRINPTRS